AVSSGRFDSCPAHHGHSEPDPTTDEACGIGAFVAPRWTVFTRIAIRFVSVEDASLRGEEEMKLDICRAGIIALLVSPLVLFALSAEFNRHTQNRPVAEIHFDSVREGMPFFPATVNSAGPFQFL